MLCGEVGNLIRCRATKRGDFEAMPRVVPAIENTTRCLACNTTHSHKSWSRSRAVFFKDDKLLEGNQEGGDLPGIPSPITCTSEGFVGLRLYQLIPGEDDIVVMGMWNNGQAQLHILPAP